MPALMLGAFAERVRFAVSFRPDTHGSVHSMSLCAGTLPAQQNPWAKRSTWDVQEDCIGI